MPTSALSKVHTYMTCIHPAATHCNLHCWCFSSTNQAFTNVHTYVQMSTCFVTCVVVVVVVVVVYIYTYIVHVAHLSLNITQTILLILAQHSHNDSDVRFFYVQLDHQIMHFMLIILCDGQNSQEAT